MPDDAAIRFVGLSDLDLVLLHAEVVRARIVEDKAFETDIMAELKRRDLAELERRQQAKEIADACA